MGRGREHLSLSTLTLGQCLPAFDAAAHSLGDGGIVVFWEQDGAEVLVMYFARVFDLHVQFISRVAVAHGFEITPLRQNKSVWFHQQVEGRIRTQLGIPSYAGIPDQFREVRHDSAQV